MQTCFSCALVGAAAFDVRHFLQERFDAVVAVDGGYEALVRSGVRPDFAIGDFDSLGYVPRDVAIERHPSMKDDSDTALALDWARRRGFDSVAFYGVLGGRLDHTHAALAALAHATRSGMRAAAIGEGSVVTVLSSQGYSTLDLPAYDQGTFSVFAYGAFAPLVTERGSKYEIDGVAMRDDSTLGLSNEFAGSAVRIAVREGDAAVYLPACPLSDLRFS